MCLTRKARNGRVVFVQKQKCRHCGKEDFHLPDDCFALKKNAEMKKQQQELRRKRQRS